MGGGAESWDSLDPYSQCWFTSGKIIAEVHPKEWGVQAPHRASQPVVLHQEDKFPKLLDLKVRGAYFWESQRAMGNRDFTLKGDTKPHPLQDPGKK